MKQKTTIFTIMGLGILFLLSGNCIWAFAQSSNEKPTPINIIQSTASAQVEPISVDVKAVNKIHAVIRKVELDFEEEYDSQYIDVQEYRHVAFYVLPDQSTSLPSPYILYQLDAFFSLRDVTRMPSKIESKSLSSEAAGWNEFGSVIVKSQGSTGESLFTRLTTGKTTSRVLYTNVYGPFVRVVLKNLTPGKRRKFEIVAYLTR